MKNKFTKKQQRRIDSCKDEKMKELWIDHFNHINEIKQSESYKAFLKEEKLKYSNY